MPIDIDLINILICLLIQTFQIASIFDYTCQKILYEEVINTAAHLRKSDKQIWLWLWAVFMVHPSMLKCGALIMVCGWTQWVIRCQSLTKDWTGRGIPTIRPGQRLFGARKVTLGERVCIVLCIVKSIQLLKYKYKYKYKYNPYHPTRTKVIWR